MVAGGGFPARRRGIFGWTVYFSCYMTEMEEIDAYLEKNELGI